MNYAYSSVMLVYLTNERSLFLGYYLATSALSPYSFTFNVLERLNKRMLQRLTLREAEKISAPPEKDPAGGTLEQRYREYAMKSFLRALWQINRLGKLEGYRHCVFLQPEVVLESEGLLSPHDRDLKRLTLQLNPYKQYEWYMKSLRAQLPGLFQEMDIPFYDLGTICGDTGMRGDLYVDYCHLTPVGADVVAAKMCDILYPQIRGSLPPGGSHENAR
jgi:hypothetical protein